MVSAKAAKDTQITWTFGGSSEGEGQFRGETLQSDDVTNLLRRSKFSRRFPSVCDAQSHDLQEKNIKIV